MACLVKSFLALIIILVDGVIPGFEPHNFPLPGCSTDDMDVMFLYYYNRDETLTQNSVSASFAKHLLSFPHNKTTPRVMLADVYDRFSIYNHHVNVSSWNFRSTLGSQTYGLKDEQIIKPHYKAIEEVIELKITFVKRLFSEMGSVRNNVTHIAVIFLDGAGLSYEESRSVPRNLQQQSTYIKIFVVVLGVVYGNRMVHLRDTLLITHYNNIMNKHILTLAMCNQCMQGWWSFENNVGTDSFSCYKFSTLSYTTSSSLGRLMCNVANSGLLAGIETQEEMNALRSRMVSYFTELGNQLGDSKVAFSVYIGLYRDKLNLAKRFQWEFTFPPRDRPMVGNYWLPGKPSEGHSRGCGVWQFVRSDHKTGLTNVSNSEDSFVDGWADVGCFDVISKFSLCEVVLPRRINDGNKMRIRPARNTSVRQALTKGDFIIFEGNIISVSANIANINLQQFLKETQNEFPTFDCGVGARNPRYISYVFVCDYVDHCSNRRDESFCLLETRETTRDEQVYANNCNGVYCCDGSCLPLQWVNDGEVDCTVCDYSSGSEANDESLVLNKFLKSNMTCALICNRDQCVSDSQLHDGHYDCTGPEGPLDEAIGKLEAANTCYNILGHIIWAPRCVYVKDMYGAVIGCRDMSHLERCTDFECPEGYFKCPKTYCIPQHYVLDWKVDCPTGEEEQDDIIDSCTGNFACWDSKVCLHPDLVCDGHQDCPHQDDEVDCDVTCVESLHCVSGTIAVSDHNRSIQISSMGKVDERTRFMDMSGVDLSVVDMSFLSVLEKLIIIKWAHCNMSSLPYLFSASSRVQYLDISYNLIHDIDGRDYSLTFEYIHFMNVSYNNNLVDVRYFSFPFLETLDLSYTGLSDIDASFLVGLPNLKHLNLSYTLISNFSNMNYHSSLILQTLDIRGLHMEIFYESFFNGLTIREGLYTDSFEVCCPQIRGANIPYYTCHSPGLAISSCFHLLGVNVQRILLWAIAALAVLGNMTVIGYRIICDRSVLRTGYGIFVTNLGISDCIMGVYLFIIGGADYYYRDIYVLSDKTWRESMACRLAGFLATLSCETSTFFVFLITLDRFLVMKFPFGQIRFSEVGKIIALLLSWIVGFLLALIPVLFRSEIFSSNVMCIGLPLTINRLMGWEYSFGVFIVLNVSFCIVIAYGQRAIFRAMSENRITGTSLSNSSRLAKDLVVAKQLSLVALSNFLCWFPVGVMGVLSLLNYEISNDVYAWTTVIVLPINSAANPLLYTIPALMARLEKFNKGNTKTRTTSFSMSST